MSQASLGRLSAPNAFPYPAPANHIDDDPTPKDQAIYVPAITPGLAKALYDIEQNGPQRALPNGVMQEDLNFLSPLTTLFSTRHILYSYGLAKGVNDGCIITQRDRKKTILICDSGGYQVASGSLRISGSKGVIECLRWMEAHGDYAMTLDVPPGPCLTNPAGYRYATTQDCLTQTLEYLDIFQRHRAQGKLRLLNVLQGNNLQETDHWYEAVKGFRFEGWAFAGRLRHDMYALLRRILRMAGEGMLEQGQRDWIHVLGTVELDVAVMLTAVQRAINRHMNPSLRISFDTASPSRMLRGDTVYTLPRFGTDNMTMGAVGAPDAAEFVGSPVRFPWSSPLGNKMLMGDFCVPRKPMNSRYRDGLSNVFQFHHNLSALCFGVALANRVFDAEGITGQHTVATSAAAAVEAIERVISAGTETELNRYYPVWAALNHKIALNSGDDDRTP
jgi:hypothetical protein